MLLITLYLCSMLASTLAHGYVHSVIIDGQSYPGWFPFTDPYKQPTPITIVRKIQDDGPVSSSEQDLACNHDGMNGTDAIANVTAGSQVIFQWDYWPADHQGPVSTYMASCGDNCATFSAAGARWFKIDAEGYYPDENLWAADKLRSNNNSWTSTIPTELAPGQYLIRHEIIALHSVIPQFYPACVQVCVMGTGAGQPSDSDLVSIPGLYDNVAWPNIYGSSVSFTIPGPPSVTFGDNAGSTTTSSTATGTSISKPEPATPTATSSGRCTLLTKRLLKRRLLKPGH